MGGGAFVEAMQQKKKKNPDLYVPPSQRTSGVNQTMSTTSVYTVKSGDSLFKISARVYGNGAYWKPILDANRDQLSGPQSLRPGMVLRIPPNPRN